MCLCLFERRFWDLSKRLADAWKQLPEGQRGVVCVCVCVRVCGCVCVCVCVRYRERNVFVCVCVRERERVWRVFCVRECVWVRV